MAYREHHCIYRRDDSGTYACECGSRLADRLRVDEVSEVLDAAGIPPGPLPERVAGLVRACTVERSERALAHCRGARAAEAARRTAQMLADTEDELEVVEAALDRLRAALDPENPTPLYPHDCDRCTHLGPVATVGPAPFADLWAHVDEEGDARILVRHSEDVDDYSESLRGDAPVFAEGWRRWRGLRDDQEETDDTP